MKCEKCGNNEAVFFYSADINGEKSRGCLCRDCAQREGLTAYQTTFGPFGDVFGGTLSDFFARERSLLSSFGSFGAPVRSIMAPSMALPFVNVVYGVEEAPGRAEPEVDVPDDAGEDIKRRRELTALREQLRSAVSEEDYERAAELRDKLRAMETE